MSGVLDNVQLHLVNDLEGALRLKSWLGERHENNLVACDTETTGLDPRDPGARIRLIQFGDTQHGWAVPWEDWRGLALEVLRGWDGTWGLWNSAFEMKWIGEHSDFRFPRERTIDGMLGAHIIDPLGSGALKQNAIRHVDKRAGAGQNLLQEAFRKHGWGWDTVPIDFGPYHEYAALDTVLTAAMLKIQQKDLEGRYKDVFDMEMAVRFIISAMERRGAQVDLAYSQRKHDSLMHAADQIEAWGKEGLGINLGSTQQLAKVLKEHGVEFLAFTPTGLPQIDKHLLRMVANPDLDYSEAAQTIAQQTLIMRRARKYASTYFANFLAKADSGSMIHADIRTLGARTGRMSISSPALQQCPKDSALVRDAFVPGDGNVIVSCDYSQIEMRLMAELSRDPDLQRAFHTADDTGGDFFVEMGKQIYMEPGFQKKDKRRRLLKNCVPLSTQILTQRGWLGPYDVKVGDMTYGYDFTTGRTRWTVVQHISIFDTDTTPVYRLAHSNREFLCTEDHRWVADNGRSGLRGTMPRFVHARDVPGTENRIILAAPADDGDLDITLDEAALLGWVFGDGSIRRSAFTGKTAQGSDGRRRGAFVCITQTKPAEITVIKELLERIGERFSLQVNKSTGQHVFILNPDYARDLLARAGIGDSKDDFDPWVLAAGLTHDARTTMADALDAADGKSRLSGWIRFNVVQRAGSPVAELAVALGFLLGKYSKITTIAPDGKGWQKNPVQTIDHQRPTFTGQRATMVHVSDEPVWCVSTELGTWTMRQYRDQTPVLTGNTMYGKAYGAGPEKMAESAGIPVDHMREVVANLDMTFPGINAFMKQVEQVGKARQAAEGQGYVTTKIGRRLPCDPNKVYTLTNYVIQSSAADVLKHALIRLDAAGYSPFMTLPVHDEVVFDIPADYAEQALREVPLIMQELDHPVALLAESAGPFDRWGQAVEA